MRRMIGEKINIFVGLATARARSCHCVTFSSSVRARRRSFPVALRSAMAFLFRRTGSNVSRIKTTDTREMTPAYNTARIREELQNVLRDTGLYHDENEPECPAPAAVLREEATHDGSDDLEGYSQPKSLCGKGEVLTGPRRGPMLKSAIALPRSAETNKSAMVPPPTAMGAAPAQPHRKRKARNIEAFVLRAQPIMKASYTRLQT